MVPALAVLREDPGRGLQRLRHLQPHVPAGLLRRPDRGVLGAAQRRDRVGRVGRADRRDHRPGCVGVHQHADLPRPDEVRRRPGQVRAHHGRGRRDRQRPGPAARRGRSLVAGPRRLGRRAVGARGRDARRDGRQGPRARGLSRPGPGPEVEGRHADAVRPGHRRHQVLLDADDRGRRHPGRHQPDRLDRRGRLRDLPARPVAWRRPVGPDHGGRQAAQHPADRAVRGAPDRGRHLQLRLGHDHRRQPVPRHGPRAARRAAGRRLHRQGGARGDPRDGRRPQAGRHRGRRRRAPVRALAQVRRAVGRQAGRHRDRPDLVAPAREEHRLRLGPDRPRRIPATSSRSSRPTAGSGRPGRPRSRSSTRARPSRSADRRSHLR